MQSVISAIQPKAPGEKGWIRNLAVERYLRRASPTMDNESVFAVYDHPMGYRAISSVEVMNEPGEPSLGPEYHLSISQAGRRCSSQDAAHIKKVFGLEDAREDNHVRNGIARDFWRPVADHLSGYECPCQDSEPAIREDKGDFIWRPAPAR